MLCPLCKLEMRITSSRNVVEHDDTPDEVTKLYSVQDLSCMNRDCANYDKVVETVKNELPIG